MNCLNGARYLKEAIDSVFMQTYTDWEIIFWDNASKDNSAEIAKSYNEKLKYFKSEETVPLGQSRNWAIEKAEGEYIAILDCDDIWLPEKLERQIPFFRNTDVALVYSDVIQFNNRGYAMPKYGKHIPPQGRVFDKIILNNYLCMGSVIIRSSVIKKYGNWFDPEFTAIEDTDLFIRISRNWDISYAPYALCKYRMHENSMTFSAPMIFRKEVELMLEKYKKMYPEFKDVYEKRIREYTRCDDAVAEWKQGHNSKAKKILRPLIFKGTKYLLIYIAMFFSYRIVQNFRILFSNRAISND